MPQMRVTVSEDTDKILKAWSKYKGLDSKARAVEILVDAMRPSMTKDIIDYMEREEKKEERMDKAAETLRTSPDHGAVQLIRKTVEGQGSLRGGSVGPEGTVTR